MSRRRKEGRRIKAEIGKELRRDRATLRREKLRMGFLWHCEGIPLPLALLEARNRRLVFTRKRF